MTDLNLEPWHDFYAMAGASAGALVVLLIIGMRNAWDIATFMIMGGPIKPGEIPDDF